VATAIVVPVMFDILVHALPVAIETVAFVPVGAIPVLLAPIVEIVVVIPVAVMAPPPIEIVAGIEVAILGVERVDPRVAPVEAVVDIPVVVARRPEAIFAGPARTIVIVVVVIPLVVVPAAMDVEEILAAPYAVVDGAPVPAAVIEDGAIIDRIIPEIVRA